MRRIMIAGTGSGSGKTTITCALLKAFIDRGHRVAAFKCGPDYIDPMFHRKITGANAGNLDACFCDGDTMKYLLNKYGEELSLIEGVMGYFDGVGEQGSSRQVASETGTPAVIVVDCKGMSLSIGAVMKGFLGFRSPNHIAGFIFNRLPQSQVPLVKRLCREMDTGYFGYMPYAADCVIGSRHLGLVTADEIADIKERLDRLSALAGEHILLDRLWELASKAEHLTYKKPDMGALCRELGYAGGNREDAGWQRREGHEKPLGSIRLGIARDEAFCFYYRENLELLERLGCELVAFSPLWDRALPEGISGLILGGGYPELYARLLSENEVMRRLIRQALETGLPTIAECGGFLYLHRELEDTEGVMRRMAGYLDGSARRTGKLQRFGYVSLNSSKNTMLLHAGESMAAHEFHYWDSSHCGTDYEVVKLKNGESYSSVVADAHLYAGFPHLYFYANPKAAVRFVTACDAYRKSRM